MNLIRRLLGAPIEEHIADASALERTHCGLDVLEENEKRNGKKATVFCYVCADHLLKRYTKVRDEHATMGQRLNAIMHIANPAKEVVSLNDGENCVVATSDPED